jgi:SAM-dependent methyltransferase
MATQSANEKATPKLDAIRDLGTRIDFGKTAGDYAKHRAGFPQEFFERLATMGVIAPGMKALDLGTGTGTVARGLAMRGLEVIGLDKSVPLMEAARQLDADAGVAVAYVEGKAEATGLPMREPGGGDGGAVLALVRARSSGGRGAATAQTARAPGHLQLRLDTASGECRGRHRKSHSCLERRVESMGRDGNVSACLARFGPRRVSAN